MAMNIMDLPMPSKKPNVDLFNPDAAEGSPDEEAAENPDEEASENKAKLSDQEAEEVMAPVSDKQLLTEAKTRGLV